MGAGNTVRVNCDAALRLLAASLTVSVIVVLPLAAASAVRVTVRLVTLVPAAGVMTMLLFLTIVWSLEVAVTVSAGTGWLKLLTWNPRGAVVPPAETVCAGIVLMIGA